MEERLQKILSRYGIASRRKAEELISERRVRVNGNTASLGDTAVDGEDVIEVDGVRLKKEPERLYLMLNKPRGYVTTLSDEKGRKNVSELVQDCGGRVYPVGRLDLYSEGLLLMTNDGEFANRIMHPKKEIEKKYLVWVSGYREGCEETLRQPIEIDGRMTQPAKLRLLSRKDETALFEFVIHEGRNRQLRRLCEAAGLRVTRLRRIAEGPLTLGELPTGAWRPLNGQELEALERALEGR
jgi:23S rRNA pseudouridine2605 synthase